jgi:lipoprotein signal peptidase
MTTSRYPTGRWLVCFFGIVLAGAALDIFTKDQFSGKLPDALRGGLAINQTELIPNYFSLLLNSPLNKGALFSFLNDRGDLANKLFITISCIAILGLAGWALWPHRHRTAIYTVTLGLIMAGAIGNAFDRLLYGGVRDWIWVYFRNAAGEYPFNWPVFNLADCFLVGGAILLGLHGIFFAPKDQPKAAEPIAVNPAPVAGP